MYNNLYINARFCTYTLHRQTRNSLVVHFWIFFLNSLKDFKHFKFLGSNFQIWTPKEAIVYVPYKTVFTFLHCRRTSFRKLYWWFLIWNTSFIISGAILWWTLNISISKVCMLCWWIVTELPFSKTWWNDDLKSF